MAKNISLLGADYPGVPAVQLPQTGGGTATFYDIEVYDGLDSNDPTKALSAKQGKVLNDKIIEYEQKQWTPKLYDLDTYKRDFPAQSYVKIGGLYVMFLSVTNFDFSGISTMVQIRNLPCTTCIGGTVYLQGRTQEAIAARKGDWVQGSSNSAFPRNNVISTDFTNASTGSLAAQFVLFGL